MADPPEGQAHGPSSAENSSISVQIRLRPASDGATDIKEMFSFPVDKHAVITIKDPLSRGRMEHSYAFSRIFQPHHDQKEVFEQCAKPLVDHMLNGFNACMFAYGQTGSGKTYSIFGEGAGNGRGLLPRAIEYAFDRIEQRAETKEVGLVVSFLEIYLDQVRDLGRAYLDRNWRPPSRAQTGPGPQTTGGFDSARQGPVRTSGVRLRPLSAQSVRQGPGSRPGSATRTRPSSAQAATTQVADDFESQDLEIHETPNGQVYVKDLTLVPVKNITEVLDVVNLGVALRATHETKVNATSSRSHTIFSINVVQKDRRMPDAEVISGVLNLVDLAGSERLARSKSEGRRFQEAVIINASLSALGKVVLALASKHGASKHIPYRDSKLTRVLQSSLGGNSHTSVLCCIAPDIENYEESLNTLAFAERCKNVQNRPTINYVDPSKAANERRIRRLLAEIADLKQQLEVSKASFDNKLGYMNETLGVGQGAPEALKELDKSEQQQKGFQDTVDTHSAETAARIRAEREKRLKAQRKAEEAVAKFQNAHKEMGLRDEERRREVIGLRDRTDALHQQLHGKQQHWQEMSRRQDLERQQQLREQGQAFADELEKRDEVIRRIPEEMKNAKLLLEMRERKWRDEQNATHARHQDALEKLTQSHQQHSQQVEAQHRHWMDEKDKEVQSFVAEFEAYRSRTKQEAKRYREELVGLFDLVQQLTKIISDLESGKYPTQYKCGVQTIQLPYGVKQKLPTEQTFEKLFQALQDVKVKANRYMAITDQLPRGPDGRRSGPPFNAKSFAQDFLNLREGRENAQAKATKTLSSTGGFGTPHANQGIKDDAPLAVPSIESAAMAHLTRDELMQLASELKRQNTMPAERQGIRDQVLKELSSHQTVEYIRHLEQQLGELRKANR